MAYWALAVGVLGYLMGTAVPLIFYVIPKERARMRAANAPWISHDWKRLRSLLVLAFPLGIVMLLVSLTGNVPQYAIERSLGTQQLGVFAALSYLIVAGSTVVGALGQSAAPRLAVYFAARNFQAFWSLSRRLMAIGVALGIGGFVLARLIGGRMLSILYAPEYAAQTEVLEVLAIAAGFSFAASFAGYSMTAARKFAVQAPLFGGVLLVSVGASFGLVSEFGLMGAAFALMLTSAVQLALSLLVLKRRHDRAARTGDRLMTEKIRVLHVVGSMNRGGVETWLMHVLRNIDRERFQFDFLVHTSQPAAYDDEIRSLGGRIISCARPKIGKQYPQEFRRAVRTNGPFDVLHSHVHHFSGVTLSLGAALGIPVRIAHSHSDLSVADRAGSHRRKTYLRATEVAIARSATLKLAASEQRPRPCMARTGGWMHAAALTVGSICTVRR